jgi:hypothetical protein
MGLTQCSAVLFVTTIKQHAACSSPFVSLTVGLVQWQVNSQYVTLSDDTQTTKCSDDCSNTPMRHAVLTPTVLRNASRPREIRSPAKEDAITAAAERERFISSRDSAETWD